AAPRGAPLGQAAAHRHHLPPRRRPLPGGRLRRRLGPAPRLVPQPDRGPRGPGPGRPRPLHRHGPDRRSRGEAAPVVADDLDLARLRGLPAQDPARHPGGDPGTDLTGSGGVDNGLHPRPPPVTLPQGAPAPDGGWWAPPGGGWAPPGYSSPGRAPPPGGSSHTA